MRWLPALLAIALAVPVRAADKVDRLAVLEISSAPGVASEEQVALLTDLMRGEITSALRRLKSLSVLTRQSMAAQLPADQLACDEGGCMARIGQRLNADFVLGGDLKRTKEGRLALVVEAFESRTAHSLGGRTLVAGSLDELRKMVSGRLASEVLSWMRQELEARERKRESGFRASTDFPVEDARDAQVGFETEPPGAAVLLDAQPLCPSTPCRKRIPRGIHHLQLVDPWHQPHEATLRAERDETVRVELRPDFARLNLSSDPTGVPVLIDGVGIGFTPVSGWRLRAGVHRIELRQDCFQPQSFELVARAGAEETRHLSMVPRSVELELGLRGEEQLLEGRVRVDGLDAGTLPGLLRLPVCARELELLPDDGRYGVVRYALGADDRKDQRLEFSAERVDHEEDDEAARLAWLRQRVRPLGVDLSPAAQLATSPTLGTGLSFSLFNSLLVTPRVVLHLPASRHTFLFGRLDDGTGVVHSSSTMLGATYRHPVGARLSLGVTASFDLHNIPLVGMLVPELIGAARGPLLNFCTATAAQDILDRAPLAPVLLAGVIAAAASMIPIGASLSGRSGDLTPGLNVFFPSVGGELSLTYMSDDWEGVGISVGLRANSALGPLLLLGVAP